MTRGDQAEFALNESRGASQVHGCEMPCAYPGPSSPRRVREWGALAYEPVDATPARTHRVMRPRWWGTVDLVGAYSKHQDLADQLRRVLDRLGRAHEESVEDPEHSVRTTAKAAVPHRVVDRLGEQAVQRMIEERQAGAELRELAARYEISLSSVKRIVRLFLASQARDGR